MSTIEFEKGKFYRTRCGSKTECVHTNVKGGKPFLFVREGGGFYTTDKNGVFLINGREDGLDIISEWREERVVWVVRSGRSGCSFVYDLYQDALNCLTFLAHHPANSLTRVVTQDGHIDTE